MLKLMKNVKGASLVEYGLLTGLIAVAAIGAVSALGTEVDRVFDVIASELGRVNVGS